MRRTEQGKENFKRAAVVDSHAAESPVRIGLKDAGGFGSTGNHWGPSAEHVLRGDERRGRWSQPA